MSEFVEPEFVAEEFLETISSNVLDAIAEHDDAKRKYFALAATIRQDLPEREQFAEFLSGGASEVAYAFGEVALATYESYGLHLAKEAMVDLWYYEQKERINFMGGIVACSSVDCHENYPREKIQQMVDDFFVESLDEDELLNNAKDAYFDALESDAQGFVNHIEAIRNEPKSLLSLLVPAELNARLNTDALKDRAKAVTIVGTGVVLGGLIIQTIFKRRA